MAEEEKKNKGRCRVLAKVGDNPNPTTPPPPPPGSGMTPKVGSIVVKPHKKVKIVMTPKVAKRTRGYTINKYGTPKAEVIIWDKDGRKKKH